MSHDCAARANAYVYIYNYMVLIFGGAMTPPTSILGGQSPPLPPSLAATKSCANCLTSSLPERKVGNAPFAFLGGFHMGALAEVFLQDFSNGYSVSIPQVNWLRLRPRPVLLCHFLVELTKPHPVNLECIFVDFFGPSRQLCC